MRTRFLKAIGVFIAGVGILIILGTAPIWILIWIFFGFDIMALISRKINSESQNRVAELQKETEQAIKEAEKALKDHREGNAVQKEIDRLKREN